MRKLLRADFRRLASSKTFWFCMVGMLVLSVSLLFNIHGMEARFPEEEWFLENNLFNYPPILGFVIAAVAGMVTGADYADGTIRNKLIAGSERRWVYLSQLIVNCAAGLALAAVYVAPIALIGPHVSDGFENSGKAALLIAMSAFGLLGFSAISTAFALGMQNRTAAVLTSLALMTGLFTGASYLHEQLMQGPTMPQPIVITQDGVVSDLEEVPNPFYVDGIKREIFQWLNDTNPHGQALQLADRANPEHLERWPFTAAAVMLLSSGIGYAIFKRKDIK